MRHLLGLLLGVWFLTVPASAELTSFLFLNNAGGLNDGSGSTAIKDNEASDLQNIVFTTGGFLTKRSGSALINSSAISGTPIFTGLTYFKRAAGTQFLVAVLSDDTIRKMDYASGAPDGTWDTITGALSFAVGADDQADFVVAENSLIIEDGLGTTAPYLWTGSGNAATLGATAPNATMVEYHKRQAFAAGDATNPSRVYFSNLNNITTWTTATDFFAFDTNDGSVVRAIRRSLDAVYVWKDYSIHRITGDERDTFRAERMVDGIGTCARQSVQRLNNRFLFQTCDGKIAIYDGGITVQIISDKIQGTLDNLNQTRFDESVGTVFDEDYYLAVSSSGASQHNRLLVFDTGNRAWTKFVGLAPNALTVFERGDGNFDLGFGDYSGFARRYPSGNTDNGTAVSAYYLSKWFAFPQLPNEKRWRILRVFADQEGTGQTLTAETRVDFESAGASYTISLAGSGSQWGTMVWGRDTWGGGSVVIDRHEVNLGANFFQVYFTDNSTNVPFTVRGYEMVMEESGRL